jgi:tetratricopeptide (TPR) repeat protein
MTSAYAQTLKVPAPSPQQTVKQNFALSDVTIEYSRPSVKGRVIFGDLVPYGKIWRTGANSATKITFGEDVSLEGKAVKAGTYALYTIPEKDSWTIMLYKDLTLGGNVNDYKAEDEAVRFSVAAAIAAEKTETFAIGFDDIGASTMKVVLSWDKTRVAFNIKADIEDKIMKNIQTAMFDDKRPYYQAASYYYDNGKDLKQALEWASKAAELNPSAYWVMLLKAKIQFKMKDYQGASVSAQKVIELATADKDDTYVGHGKKMLEDIKSAK